MKIETYIETYNPCYFSCLFLRQFETFEEAWEACHRGDWMLSAARLLEVDFRTTTLAQGHCANTVRHLMKDPRSTAAVDAAIAFGRGEVDIDKLRTFNYPAWCARHEAQLVFFPDATNCANGAAFAAADAAYDAVCDVAPDEATADHASAAAAADAGNSCGAEAKNLKQTADICREFLTKAVMERVDAIAKQKGE